MEWWCSLVIFDANRNPDSCNFLLALFSSCAIDSYPLGSYPSCASWVPCSRRRSGQFPCKAACREEESTVETDTAATGILPPADGLLKVKLMDKLLLLLDPHPPCYWRPPAPRLDHMGNVQPAADCCRWPTRKRRGGKSIVPLVWRGGYQHVICRIEDFPDWKLSGGSSGASSNVLTDISAGGSAPCLLTTWMHRCGRLCWVSSRPIATRNSPLGRSRTADAVETTVLLSVRSKYLSTN